MRVALQYAAVHKGAGVALVAVAGDIFFIRLGTVGELPFCAGAEARAAAAAKPAALDGVYDLLAGHFGKHLGKGLITVEGYVFVDIFRVYNAAVAQSHAVLLFIKADIGKGGFVHLPVFFIVIDELLYYAPL